MADLRVVPLKRAASSWNGLTRCQKKRKLVAREFMDLPKDLAEEVLSRVPMTSLRKVRSTCKTWNALSRSKSFAKKHLDAFGLEKDFMVVVMMDYQIYLMGINLQEEEESCFNIRGKLISLDPSYQFDVSQVFHCNGLLLCVSTHRARLAVWNPFSGQTQWIDPTPNLHSLRGYSYALGYDKRNNSHKVFRFCDLLAPRPPTNVDFGIYDLNSASGSWRALDFGTTQFWYIYFHDRGVSLKGNTYWFATDGGQEEDSSFLICFDFTTERFGPRLLLPSSLDWCHPHDTTTLSIVREEQLVLLFQRWDTLVMEIWITTKIEPDAVSWSHKFFLQVDMTPLTDYQFPYRNATFFIDEEKKVAVVFDKDRDLMNPTRNAAYIVGEDGSLKEVDLGESPNRRVFPRVCPYVPSLLNAT